MMIPLDNTPILVAGACKTFRDVDNYHRTLVDGLDEVSRLAFDDSGRASLLRQSIDAIATIRFAMGLEPGLREQLAPEAPGAALARRWGIEHCRYYTSTDSGNVSQYLINHFADSLTRGEHRAVLIGSCELIATVNHARKNGTDLSHWKEATADEPVETIGPDNYGCSEMESLHGFYPPANGFALMESAVRHQSGRSIADHQRYLGELFSRFNAVAVRNPNAWFRTPRTAVEIATATEQNRYVSFPYTKYMCAVMGVNMAAAVIMTTVGNAKRLGIPENKWVYLTGCADVDDTLYLSERPLLHDSVALWTAVDDALRMANRNITDVAHYDIYACFPAVVEISCKTLGIDPLQRQLTVTGGLPYYGGPGSAFSLHSAVQMMSMLRQHPGASGMLIAHGWYMAKESVGIYSTTPSRAEWQRTPLANLRQRAGVSRCPINTGKVEGNGVIEACTVQFDKSGPCRGIMIGRQGNGTRFVAATHEECSFRRMMSEDMIGRHVIVSHSNGINTFTFKD